MYMMGAVTAINNDDDEIIISRRQDEIEALQAFYGQQLRSSLRGENYHTSTSYYANDVDDDHMINNMSPNGPWFIELVDISSINSSGGGENNGRRNNIHKSVPTLEIRLPPRYPLSSSQDSDLPTPILHHANNHLTLAQQQSLLDELMAMYEAEMDVAIMWAERCREEFVDVDLAIFADNQNRGNGRDDLPTADDKDKNYSTTDEINSIIEQQQQQSLCIRFLTFNHLLHGKAHKKESQIVSLAAKLGLTGLIVYGTPGVIGLLSLREDAKGGMQQQYQYNGGGISTTAEDIIDFAKECNRIGKRATLLEFELHVDHNDGRLLPYSLVVEGKKNDGGKSKLSNSKKKSKGNNNGNGRSNTADSSSSTPLLSNLLGSDRVSIKSTTTNSSSSSVSISIKKAGLHHYDSCAELKDVLPSGIIQSILGIK